MVEEILENVYRIVVPLPKNPLKTVNSYVLRGSGRNLIIDTGLNRKECKTALQEGLAELGVNLRKTDFFITHLHADHFALVSTLAKPESTVYFNRPEAEKVKAGASWNQILQFAKVNGFPEEELQTALQMHPGYRYSAKFDFPLRIIKEGDAITIGEYSFRCVETPGHTPGHTCLYEPGKKILVSGDHVLKDITPNIQSWSDDGDPLRDYLYSLDKIYNLDVRLVLPGHRRIFTNCKRRILELKKHHKDRAGEVLTILGGSTKNAFQVASKMTWDIHCDSWSQFPIAQKWFATGEAIAHLQYLKMKGTAVEKRLGGKTAYAVNKGAEISDSIKRNR